MYFCDRVSILPHSRFWYLDFGTVPTVWYFLFFYQILELFWQCGILELFRQCGILELFWQCGILELFRQCGILELFWQCGILELFRQCGILELFRQCGIFCIHLITYNGQNIYIKLLLFHFEFDMFYLCCCF